MIEARRVLAAVTLGAAVTAVAATAAVAQPRSHGHNNKAKAERVFTLAPDPAANPEGIAVGKHGTFYVSITGDGAIYSGSLGSDTVSPFIPGTAGDSAGNGLTGGAGADQILGLGGNDTVNGGGGNDWIAGGTGNDSITGSGGQDSFVFAEYGAANADTITDFAGNAWDSIRLDASAFTAIGASGRFSSGDVRFWAGTAAHDADDRIVYNSTTGQTTAS